VNQFAFIPIAIIGVILLIGCVAFGICLFLAWRARTKIAAIESARTADVGDLDDGYWKSSGRVVALEEPLVSPMTQTECVFYTFQVDELRTRTVTTTTSRPGSRGGFQTGTRTETYWETVITDRQAIRCAIRDKTGEARVDLLDAETVLNPSAHSTSGTFQNCPAHLQRTLSRRYGFSTKGLLFNKGLRYTETVIEEGNKLFVIGDVEMSRRGEPEFIRGKQPFIVSDRSEAKLVGHFRTRATWWLVGAGTAAVLTPVFAIVLSIFAFQGPNARNDAKPFAAADAGPEGPAVPNGFMQNNPGGAIRNDNARPQPNNPLFPDIITTAIAELRSPDPVARARGAMVLTTTKQDPARREEVLRALRPVTTDADPNTRTWALRAVIVWEKGPDSTTEGYYYQNQTQELPDVAIPWTAALDPVPAPSEGPAASWGAIPLGFLYKTVVFPALSSPFVAVSPKQPMGRPEVEGLTLVYDLRTGRPATTPFLAKTGLGERFALAPDGKYVAGRVTNLPSNFTIDVVETTTGRSIRRIVAGHGKEFASPIEFIGPDRLLTMTHENQLPDPQERTDYKVWDIRTGELVSEFSYDLVYGPKWGALSSGGRYLVFQQVQTVIGYRLVIFDLTTGKVAGDVIFQPKSEPHGQAAGITFSPDGKEFAILWHLGKKPDLWAKILVFDATTGKRLTTHSLGYEMKNIDSLWFEGGPRCIQWLPNGSGWLICGHLLVDRQTGAVTGRVGAEPKTSGDIPPRRFVGPGLVTTLIRNGIDTGLTLESVWTAERP